MVKLYTLIGMFCAMLAAGSLLVASIFVGAVLQRPALLVPVYGTFAAEVLIVMLLAIIGAVSCFRAARDEGRRAPKVRGL